ncbi:hypothetical protein VTK73DRAFT_7436 [Phialemonium thermophilum]|uniref:Uncharacterized protein n=1 Tax=Phialemonium thermophilum TaxID=223376 RepID=A0ABR3WEE4_9PEZI
MSLHPTDQASSPSSLMRFLSEAPCSWHQCPKEGSHTRDGVEDWDPASLGLTWTTQSAAKLVTDQALRDVVLFLGSECGQPCIRTPTLELQNVLRSFLFN